MNKQDEEYLNKIHWQDWDDVDAECLFRMCGVIISSPKPYILKPTKEGMQRALRIWNGNGDVPCYFIDVMAWDRCEDGDRAAGLRLRCTNENVTLESGPVRYDDLIEDIRMSIKDGWVYDENGEAE